MANSSSQNNPLTYMDGISVKIAENYKPPKRIPMVMSYSQRVALNKLILEPTLVYDFNKEQSIKNKMYEWQKARTAIKEQRKIRLNQLTQAMNRKSLEKEVADSSESESTTENVTSDSLAAAADTYYQTESGILIPKVISTEQSKLLTPIPTSNSHRTATGPGVAACYSYKHPINYSEFESDTSSPFDNMELKVLNDLEELAQVLKYDSDENSCNAQRGKLTGGYIACTEQRGATCEPPPNGYIGQRDAAGVRSVSEIMRSLQADLKPAVCTEPATPAVRTEQGPLPDEHFARLGPEVQRTALAISSMGFPLPRVARACLHLEGNQKKVLEHLLAMSELLDLGFEEARVAAALLRCHNDRDKALDLLIT